MSSAITGVWPGAAESPGNNPSIPPQQWVPNTRAVLAGAGLLGGGVLESDLVLSLDPAYVVTSLLSGLVPAYGASANGKVLTIAGGVPTWSTPEIASLFIFPEDYGAIADNLADNTNAFNLAIAAAHLTGRRICPGKGTYYFASPLTVNAPVTIQGAGNTAYGTVFRFKNGIDGVVLAYQGGPVAGGSSRATITDIRVIGSGSTSTFFVGAASTAGVTVFRPSTGYAGFVYPVTVSGTTGAEPVWPTTEGATVTSGSVTMVCRYVAGFKVLSNSTYLQRVGVSGFPGDGCSVYASTGDGNNGNTGYINHSYFDSCLGYGMFTLGADANWVSIDDCSVIANGLGGVRDESFLGCKWTNMHADSNGGRPYMNFGASNRATFINCYNEGGQQPALVNGNGVWFGSSVGGEVEGTGFRFTPETGWNSIYTEQRFVDREIIMRLQRIGTYTAYEWGVGTLDGNRVHGMTYEGLGHTGWWELVYDGTTAPYALSTNLAPEGGGQIWFPQGFYAGAFDYRVPVRWLDAQPSSGAHVRGETVYKRQHTSDRILGWVCTASGTPGTWETLYRSLVASESGGAATGPIQRLDVVGGTISEAAGVATLTVGSGAATGAITFSVSTAGSDTPSVNRPARPLSGNYSAFPFRNVQAALNALPPIRDYDVAIDVGAGSFTGFVVTPWLGKGKTVITNATALATLASGVNSGTAGVGTTTTSLVKPGAAANWTLNNLLGKRVRITAGGGFDSANPSQTWPIKSNTTTAVSVDPIPGMDSTTQFQIVDLATTYTVAGSTVRGVTCCIGATDVIGDLRIEGAKPNDGTVTQGFAFFNNSRLTVSGCDLTAAIYSGAGIYDTRNLTFDRNLMTGPNAFAEIIGGTRMTAYRTMLANSRLYVEDFKDTRGWVEAQGCTGNALKLVTCDMSKWAVNATTCSATPIYLDNVLNFLPVDAGLTGSNPGAPYGIEMYNGGQALLTGATITGAANLHIEDQTVDWATLALGSYTIRGTTAIWGAGPLRFGQELTGLSDVTVGGLVKLFGFLLAADNGDPTNSAFLSNLTARAGGGQALATEVGYIATILATVASAGDSIKFRASAKGELMFIWNSTGTSANLFPPTGGTINGGVTNAAIAIPGGAFAVAISTSGVDFRVKVIA